MYVNNKTYIYHNCLCEPHPKNTCAIPWPYIWMKKVTCLVAGGFQSQLCPSFEQPNELSLVKIELTSNASLHYVTPNDNMQ